MRVKLIEKNKKYKAKMIVLSICAFFIKNLHSQTEVQSVTFSAVAHNPTATNNNKVTAVADMNNDNLDDIIVISGFNSFRISYQQANGSFDDETYALPSFLDTFLFSITIGDLDKNGFNDIVLGYEDNRVDVCYANATGTGYTVNSITSYSIFAQRATMNDLDLDGDLDIYICHDEGANLVLKNTGNQQLISDASLVDITNPLQGIDLQGNYAALWVDYDNDGDTDVYISKCKEGVTSSTDKRRINLLYKNNGDNTYTDVASDLGLADGEQSWVSVFEDFDLDGDLDVFIVNHTGENKFMRNNGNGTYTNVTASTGIEVAAVNAFEVDAFDFNNDGFIDIFSQLNKELYLNNGDLTFTGIDLDFNQNRDDIEANGGASNIFETAAVGDLNNDGFLDVFDSQGNIQYNTGNSNNWLKIKLDGVTSNSQGVGAKLELISNLGTQKREMRIGSSYAVQNSHFIHFGIGQDVAVQSIKVIWPSGTIDVIENPVINTLQTIKEGDFALSTSSSNLNTVKIFPNPFKDRINITNQLGLSNAYKSYSIIDLGGRVISTNTFKNTQSFITAETLKTGVYFLKLDLNNTSIIKRIIKE